MFRDYWNDLQESVPRLPPAHAQTLVNRAWHRICDFRLWSWLVSTGYITAPANISVGTVNTALGSNVAIFDSNASTALNAVTLSNPPLANPDIGIGRQFRIGSQISGTPGALYSIIAWDGVNTATLDRVFAETGGSGQPYMVYKAYYQPPAVDGTPNGPVDFLRYFTVTNQASGYTIRRRKLYYTQAQLNGIDPYRGATGDAYIIANYQNDPLSPNVVSGVPVHEWYPHPVNNRVYSCLYQKRGLDLSDTLDVPATFSPDLLMLLSYQLGCQWALRMVSVYPELAQTNWVSAINDARQEFKERLIQAIKADDEISPLVAFQQGGTFDFPLGGQFLQNHDVSSLVGGLD
jgi:hypothetical protein